MATNKKKRSDYISEIERIKQEYKQATGKSKIYLNSKTFKKTQFAADIKRVKKNLKDWELREKKRVIKRQSATATQILSKGRKAAPTAKKIAQALPNSVIQIIAFNEPHHLVLSYGGKIDRAIMDALDEGERLGFKVSVKIIHKAFGKQARVYTNRIAATMGFQRLYVDCNRLQAILNDSAGVTIRAFSQDQNGERIITIKTKYKL